MDPWEQSDVKVTIKYGAGYEETWLVFSGSPESVIEQMRKSFGYTDNPNATLHEVTVACTSIAQGTQIMASTLGGKIIESKEENVKTDPNAAILSAMENATSPEGLLDVWSKNREAFNNNTVLQEAYKAKRAALGG